MGVWLHRALGILAVLSPALLPLGALALTIALVGCP